MRSVSYTIGVASDSNIGDLARYCEIDYHDFLAENSESGSALTKVINILTKKHLQIVWAEDRLSGLINFSALSSRLP